MKVVYYHNYVKNSIYTSHDFKIKEKFNLLNTYKQSQNKIDLNDAFSLQKNKNSYFLLARNSVKRNKFKYI